MNDHRPIDADHTIIGNGNVVKTTVTNFAHKSEHSRTLVREPCFNAVDIQRKSFGLLSSKV